MVAGALQHPGVGRAGASDFDFVAWYWRAFDRGRGRGGFERGQAVSDGSRATAVVTQCEYPAARFAAAHAFYFDKHVGGIAAAVTGDAAHTAHRVLQRPLGWLSGHRGGVRTRRLLSRRRST